MTSLNGVRPLAELDCQKNSKMPSTNSLHLGNAQRAYRMFCLGEGIILPLMLDRHQMIMNQAMMGSHGMRGGFGEQYATDCNGN